MKQIFFLVVFIFITSVGKSQNDKQFFNLLLTNDFSQIDGYFESTIDVCIEDYEAILSRNEATRKLKSFFEKNTAKDYSIKHKGDSAKMNSGYYVVDLFTTNGLFRMFLYFDRKNEYMKISEFRIEKT